MQTLTLLDSATIIRRVHVELMRIEPVHLDVRDITDSVHEQGSPLQSLVERAEHGAPKADSGR